MADERACGEIGTAEANDNVGSGIRWVFAYTAPLPVYGEGTNPLKRLAIYGTIKTGKI